MSNKCGKNEYTCNGRELLPTITNKYLIADHRRGAINNAISRGTILICLDHNKLSQVTFAFICAVFCCFVVGIASVLQFAWAVTLRVVAQHPALPASAQACCEEDEAYLENALMCGAFEFIRESIVKSSAFTVEVMISCLL